MGTIYLNQNFTVNNPWGDANSKDNVDSEIKFSIGLRWNGEDGYLVDNANGDTIPSPAITDEQHALRTIAAWYPNAASIKPE